MRPQIGHPTLLVYRECPCGRWCATGEGDFAPACGACGGWYVPAGGTVEEPASHDTVLESRRYRGLGFVALLTSEMGAVGLVRRLGQVLGLYGLDNQFTLASEFYHRPAEAPRYLSEAETRALSDAYGPTTDVAVE